MFRLLSTIAILISVIALIQYVPVIHSFPTGAGGCVGGEAAVGGTHVGTDRTVQFGPLSDGDIEVTLNGITLEPGTVLDFPINTDLEIQVRGITIDFRGVLVRFEDPSNSLASTDNVLVPGSDGLTQVASVCTAPVVGITHIDNADKAAITGTINVPSVADGILLGVTVVFINSVDGSAYVYDTLEVNFRDVTIPPASAPATTPVTTPTASSPSISVVPSISPAPTSKIIPTASSFPSASPVPTDPPIYIHPYLPTLEGKGKGKGKGMGMGMKGKGMGKKMEKDMKKGMKMGKGKGKGKGSIFEDDDYQDDDHEDDDYKDDDAEDDDYKDDDDYEDDDYMMEDDDDDGYDDDDDELPLPMMMTMMKMKMMSGKPGEYYTTRRFMKMKMMRNRGGGSTSSLELSLFGRERNAG